MALLTNNRVYTLHLYTLLDFWRGIQQQQYLAKYPDVQITSTFHRDLDAIMKYMNRLWSDEDLNQYIQSTEYPEPIPCGEREWFMYHFYEYIEGLIKRLIPNYVYTEDYVFGYEDNVFYIVDYRRKTYVPAIIEDTYRQRRGK